MVSDSAWPGRSHVAIFIRSLYLLDLDLLQDWPGVTEQLFTPKAVQQSLQQRVKAVEWSLFRLFEAYDPAETRDKLRPFFPPTTQLQSLNLRAALYRCLTELKKTGVLGRDVLLRKTMLDDCKGERFEEVLSSFAMCALKKATNTLTHRPKFSVPDSHVVPSILAYRVSLQRNLHARDEATTNANQQLQQLLISEANLQGRLEEVQSVSLKTDSMKENELFDLVKTDWSGENVWTDILLRGIPGENVLGNDISTHSSPTGYKSQELLSDLDARIEKHKLRLTEWKSIAQSMTEERSKIAVAVKPEERLISELPGTAAQFSRHNTLNLSGWNLSSTPPQPVLESYQKLLDAMRHEWTERSTPDVLESRIDQQPMIHLPSSPPLPTTRHLTPPNESTSISTNEIPVTASVQQEPILDQNLDIGVNHQSLEGHLPFDPPWPAKTDRAGEPRLPEQPNRAITDEEDQLLATQATSPEPLPILQAPLSPSKLWLSLADRTKASMSLNSRQSILTDPESPDPVRVEPNEEENFPTLHPPSDDDRYTSLLERTRKSMSMLSGSSSSAAGPRSRKQKATKQNGPARRLSPPPEFPGMADLARASTPHEQIFSDDADYASVFKSRPKIAMSPALQPQPSTRSSVHDMDLDQT